MSTKPDDFDVAKIIVQALDPFEAQEKEKIIRWVCERLGIIQQTVIQTTPQREVIIEAANVQNPSTTQTKGKDIKTFLTEKYPKSDNQLAAAVAYYHMFEAPANQRKSFITKDDLQEATRQGHFDRLKRPDQTLVNAHHAGILDKGTEKGTYSINSVGENLVAMTMPSATGKVAVKTKKNNKRGSKTKKVVSKKK